MKKILLLIICLAMIVSLAACGNKNANNQTGDSEYADEVVLTYEADLDSADPYQSTSAACALYTNATFRSLVWSNYETGELEPQLAESWSDVNGDCTVWDVKIKQGVKFHDGTELNAEDVVFTWNYAKDATNVVKPISSADVMVKEVKAVDTYTVEFVLNSSIPDFSSYLDFKIYSKEAFDTMSAKEAGVIGCGPYKVGKLVSGVSYGLERFDDYFEGTEKFPSKTITIKVIKDLDVAVAALQSGEVDFAFDLPATGIANLQADKNINVTSADGCQSWYMGFNYKHDVWNDLNMRKAVCEAIDKDEIISLVYENGLTASRSDNFCVSTGKGYTQVDAITYNPDDAKALLEKAGKVGQEVKIMYISSGKTQATVVQSQLNAVGFKAVLSEVDGTNWTSLKGSGDYDIFVYDYCSYAGALLYNFDRFFSVGGSSNVYGFESQEWENLIAEVRACSSYEEMVAKFAECQQWAADNIPVIPVAVNKAYCAARTNVGGVKVAPSFNLLEVCYLYKTK